MNKNCKPYILGFLMLFMGICPTRVIASFDFNANCLKAYGLIFELKLNSARQLIAHEKRVNASNGIIPLLENYVDYFHLLTTDRKEEFERLEKYKSKRLDIIAEGDKSSPYYLYAQAEINLQWSLIRGRYEEYFTAAREIKKAHSLLQENQKKFPGFHLNLKGIGLINAFLGNLPDGLFKSTLATLGIKGNTNVGINMLDQLAQNLPRSKYEVFYEEVVFYYVFVLNDIAHSPLAYDKTMKYTASISDESLLKTYLQALVCSKNGHNDEALKILTQRPNGIVYQTFPYLDFLLGVAKLNKLDYTATSSFNRFLQQSKGVNYIKDANLHLAWIALLQHDLAAYNGFISKVKNDGYALHERDKQALKEANDAAPDKILLRARLLFDGGYYGQANAVLAKSSLAQFNQGRDRTEFFYRSGRIDASLGREDKALADYQNALNSGRRLKYYFSANAALQMGKIYEVRKNYSKAIELYNVVMQMKGYDYESSIKAQAKSGLNRIKIGKQMH